MNVSRDNIAKCFGRETWDWRYHEPTSWAELRDDYDTSDGCSACKGVTTESDDVE